MERARRVAFSLAERIGDELALPVFLYGELAPGLGPASFRTGGLDGLRRRVEAGELTPDFGPGRLDDRSGAVLVGARRPLIALNVNLRGESCGGPGDRLGRPRARRRLSGRSRSRLRAAARRTRAGEHECRGLGGRGAERAHRDDRARSGQARGGSCRRGARRPDAGRSCCRGGWSGPANSTASTPPTSWSSGCSESETDPD